MTLRIGVLTTHPIQYQVPWFRRLAAERGVDLTVFFCMLPDAAQQGTGFGVAFQWDVPLTEGYQWRLLENVSAKPSLDDFTGCDTPSIDAIVRDGGWDAFIVNGWVARSCLQLLWACRRYGVPCIVRGESNILRPRAFWKRWIHRSLLRQYAACLSIGQQNRAFYIANGVPPGRIFQAPYCVENERFALPERPIRTAEPFTFMFSGKLIEKKHPLDLLHATARLKETHPALEFRVLIVGDGVQRHQCEAVVRLHDLPVDFAGFLNQSQMREAYARADALVLPSDDGETWGLVVNEAMASGLPAIVSDQVGCHADLVQPGVTGSVFPCRDVDALARCMAEIAADRQKARKMGQAARVHVLQHYNYEQVLTGTLAALNDVCMPSKTG
jgi:glycosyltransferase involved in cell wall biosynthesis